jgi:phage baseplate assembly protein gpV
MSMDSLASNTDVLNPNYEEVYLIGTVVQNVDPLNLDRVKVNVPRLYTGAEKDLPWVAPFKPNAVTGQGEGFGTYGSPAIGSSVIILLQAGDPHYPVYVAGLGKKANGFFPSGTSWGFQDKFGNKVRFNEAKEIRVESAAGVHIVISPAGAVSLTSPSTVSVAAAGNLSLSSDADIAINAGGALAMSSGGASTLSAGGSATITGTTIHLNN